VCARAQLRGNIGNDDINSYYTELDVLSEQAPMLIAKIERLRE